MDVDQNTFAPAPVVTGDLPVQHYAYHFSNLARYIHFLDLLLSVDSARLANLASFLEMESNREYLAAKLTPWLSDRALAYLSDNIRSVNNDTLQRLGSVYSEGTGFWNLSPWVGSAFFAHFRRNVKPLAWLIAPMIDYVHHNNSEWAREEDSIITMHQTSYRASRAFEDIRPGDRTRGEDAARCFLTYAIADRVVEALPPAQTAKPTQVKPHRAVLAFSTVKPFLRMVRLLDVFRVSIKPELGGSERFALRCVSVDSRFLTELECDASTRRTFAVFFAPLAGAPLYFLVVDAYEKITRYLNLRQPTEMNTSALRKNYRDIGNNFPSFSLNFKLSVDYVTP